MLLSFGRSNRDLDEIVARSRSVGFELTSGGQIAMSAPLQRALLGFLAAVISVLTFHQGMWALLHLAGQMPPPYPTRGVPPFGVPLIIDLCFWGGVWGAVFGLVLPKLSGRYQMWVCGLGLGIAAALVGLFIVPLIKGLPVAGGWSAMAFVRSFLINGFWGIGVGLLLPLLARRNRSILA
jgi:hypothetical protein